VNLKDKTRVWHTVDGMRVDKYPPMPETVERQRLETRQQEEREQLMRSVPAGTIPKPKKFVPWSQRKEAMEEGKAEIGMLSIDNWQAAEAWGSLGTMKITQEGVLKKPEITLAVSVAEQQMARWTPKRDAWAGWVTDRDPEGFGKIFNGHEVEVMVMKRKADGKMGKNWLPGVVIAVSPADKEGKRMVAAKIDGGATCEVDLGYGALRRREDSRDIVTQREAMTVQKFRAKKDGLGLYEYMLKAQSVAVRSLALTTLCRLNQDSGLEYIRKWLESDFRRITSVSLRDAAHMLGSRGYIEEALALTKDFKEDIAAQLTVEVLAMAMNYTVHEEYDRLGENFQLSVTPEYGNPKLENIISKVNEALPLFGRLKSAVRRVTGNRQGLTDGFNELIFSCGRAFAVPLAFKALEWMEQLSIPKDAATYKAIGNNAVRRVSLLAKVWDLPLCPDEGPPEVVFAGRSNVGKSSLVNMLLGRSALAPTSQRPGKTKTIDFFEVNYGHTALPRFRLVDVPGLGYARASQDLRQRWIKLIGGYFCERKSLKVVFHLLDAGLCEILPADLDLWKLLAQAKRDDYELVIVMTKADNSMAQQLEKFASMIREALRKEGSQLAVSAQIFACSSMSKLGKDTLWKKIWDKIEDTAMDSHDIPLIWNSKTNTWSNKSDGEMPEYAKAWNQPFAADWEAPKKAAQDKKSLQEDDYDWLKGAGIEVERDDEDIQEYVDKGYSEDDEEYDGTSFADAEEARLWREEGQFPEGYDQIEDVRNIQARENNWRRIMIAKRRHSS